MPTGLQVGTALQENKGEVGRRPTAVSQALRALSASSGQTARDAEKRRAESLRGYTLLAAADPQAKERAYRLAHQAYCRCGHFTPNQNAGRYVLPHDSAAETLTLLARNPEGVDVATATLVYDSAAGLPCEAIFKPELDGLRRCGRRLAEVARLALDVSQRPPKSLLLRLFNVLYIHARLVRGHSDLVVEVIPRHAEYYRNLLEFEQLGPQRRWPRGRNVTATLLKLDLQEVGGKIERARHAGTNNLYRFALSQNRENALAVALRVPDLSIPFPTEDFD